MADRTLRDRFVVAIKELEAWQYGAGLARELFEGPNVDRADEVERQLMRDIDEILKHNAKLAAWVRAEIENKCAICWNRDTEPCPTFFCRYKHAKTLLEDSNI